jgi:hypothetical protein
MNDIQQSSALTPNPLSRCAGEGSIVTEMVVNNFRESQQDVHRFSIRSRSARVGWNPRFS